MTSHTDFYSTTATIIPVLFLVFAVQNRELLVQHITKEQAESDVIITMGLIIAVLTLAEAAALAGLLGLQTSLSVVIVILALGGTIQWIASSALRGRPSKLLAELADKPLWADNKARRGVYFDIWAARALISLPTIITIMTIIVVLDKDIK